jgi:predicted glycosyltransferase
MPKEFDIWIDYTNPPHVNLFKSLIKDLEKNNLSIYSTAREFVETQGLLNKYGIDFKSFGKHGGKNKISKILRLISREFELYSQTPKFKYSISSSFEAVHTTWLRRRKSIFFDDNEIAPNWIYGRFASYLFTPDCINPDFFIKSGVRSKNIIPYQGFKEDIYIADYIPDSNFLEEIPFKEYVVVRPENTKATYVPGDVKSIVPKLIEKLSKEGLNILFLPRYESDKSLIQKLPNVYSPESPINGLDACFFSTGVFTGAGTLAREAALLGKPSFSFFGNDQLLQVDLRMISDGLLFHSRSPEDLLNAYLNSLPKSFNQDKSKIVKKEVMKMLLNIVSSND